MWWCRFSNNLRTLSRCLDLLWLVCEFLLENLILNCWSKESVSIGLSLSRLLVNEFIFLLIFDSAVLNQILSLLKESLVLCLESLKLSKSIISDLFELLLILLVNFLLNLLPIIMSKVLFFNIWPYICALPLHSWHSCDSWAHILYSFSNRVSTFDNFNWNMLLLS